MTRTGRPVAKPNADLRENPAAMLRTHQRREMIVFLRFFQQLEKLLGMLAAVDDAKHLRVACKTLDELGIADIAEQFDLHALERGEKRTRISDDFSAVLQADGELRRIDNALPAGSRCRVHAGVIVIRQFLQYSQAW